MFSEQVTSEKKEFMQNQITSKRKDGAKGKIVTATLILLSIGLCIVLIIQTVHQNNREKLNQNDHRLYKINFTSIKKEFPKLVRQQHFSYQSKSNQIEDITCKNNTDKIFANFSMGLIVGSSYQNMFDDIRDLECFYANLDALSHEARREDTILCHTYESIRITLNTKEFHKLRNRNIKNGEALGIWLAVLYQFNESLQNIKSMEKSTTTRSYWKIVQRVENGLFKLQLNMEALKKAYKQCNIQLNHNIIKVPENIVTRYTEENILVLKKGNISKAELAASIFQQLRTVLNGVKEDINYRMKCLWFRSSSGTSHKGSCVRVEGGAILLATSSNPQQATPPVFVSFSKAKGKAEVAEDFAMKLFQ